MNKPLETGVEKGRAAIVARCGQLFLDQRVYGSVVTGRGRKGICVRPQEWCALHYAFAVVVGGRSAPAARTPIDW